MTTLHAPGDIIADRYRIIALLGLQSQSNTYVVEDLTQNRLVALKALSLQHMQDWKDVERLERQARVLSSLNHPAIPRYIEYFQCDTRRDRVFYLVQELIQGSSLTQLIEHGWNISEQEVRNLALQVLEILQYLHRQSPPVIHRDIRPCNLIRSPEGQIFLVDFGSVKSMVPVQSFATMTLVGTGYSPPEQFYGKACYASDLYSLGASLMFVLTAKEPEQFLHLDPMNVAFINACQTPASLSPQFAKWLKKLMETSPKSRFQSATEAIAWLRQNKTKDALKPTQTASAKTRRSRPKPPPEKSSVAPKSASLIEETVSRKKPPAGSRVIVRRTEGRLVIEVPPVRFDTKKANMFDVFGRWHQLDINTQRFLISTRRLGFHSMYEGKTPDVIKAELAVDPSLSGSARCSVLLWEGVTAHEFAPELTDVEKEWIINEIMDFFEYLRTLRNLEKMLDAY